MHIPSAMGQAPKIYNALARISTTHLYAGACTYTHLRAPIRTYAHLYAPARTYTHLRAPIRTYVTRTMRRAFGCFLEPRPRGFFSSHLRFNTSQKSRLVQCQETLAAVHVETTSAFRDDISSTCQNRVGAGP